MGTLLSIALLAVHLIAMNIAAMGPLACAWLIGNRASDLGFARQIAWLSVKSFLVSVALGLLLLAFPREAMRAALLRFTPDTFWFAGAELFFSLVCMILLTRLCRGPSRRITWAWLLALATATNLLYHFPPLMAAIGKLAADPRWAREQVISHAVLLRLAGRPEVLSLWAHFTLACIAGTAIAASYVVAAAPSAEGVVDVNARKFAAVALIATLLQVPVGAWVLLASSSPVQNAVMGQHAWATCCFAVGVLLSLGLIHALAAIAGGETGPAAARRAAGLFVGVAVLMTATLTLSRGAAAVESPLENGRDGPYFFSGS